MDTERQPHFTYEMFRDEILKALHMDEFDPERERVIRELWDLARQRGRDARDAR